MYVKNVGINAHSSRIDGCLDILKKDLTRFGEIGFSYVEIPSHGVDAVINGQLNKNVNKVIEILKEYPLKYTVHAPDLLDLKKISNSELHYDVFKASLEFCQLIGSNIFVYHLGNHKEKNILAEKARRQEIELLNEFASFCKIHDITICVENIDHSIDEVTKTIKAVNNNNVAMTLDVGHAYISSNSIGYNLLKSIKRAKPFIKHVHLHDNFGKTGMQSKAELYRLTYGYGDLHLPPGWGEAPLPQIFEILEDYQGVILAEINSQRYFEFYSDIYNSILSGTIYN